MSNKPYDPEGSARISALFTKGDREELEQLRLEKRMRQGQSGQDAMRALAMFYLPPSTREFAERHRLHAFVDEVWVQAFIAGWKAHTCPQQEKP